VVVTAVRETFVRRLVRRLNAVGSVMRHPLAVDRHRRRLEAENRHLREVYETWVPPGHFYSPFPNVDDYERRVAKLRDPHRDLIGIDLRESEQLALLETIGALVADIAFPEHPDPHGATRYWFDNPAYAYGDGTVLHGMLRHLRPRRVVEVGSGYSSAMILDTVDGWLGGTELTLIEPHPELVRGVLRPGDEARMTIHELGVQDVSWDVFDRLEQGDVLFVDSTHVVKAGSDVNHLVFEVLPRLRAGVWVHLHDVFFPFEYPEAWVREGRAWHEAYLVRAFLAFNGTFEIRWFQDFLWSRHRARLERIPWVAENPGANLWLEKVG
jgi:predicted O-methyltransferase YrrM